MSETGAKTKAEYEQAHVGLAGQSGPPSPKMPTFRADIEGLRAVAVLLVVAFHAGIPTITGGFIGVDIFFVMSGYLITGILARELKSRNTIRFKEFYARRSRRLIPASVFMVLAVLLLCALKLTLIEERPVWKASVSVVAYASNIWFMITGIDYFSNKDAVVNPLLHTWSLAVEEQFYFVWPVLLLIGHRISHKRNWLVLLLSAVSALSFTTSLVLQHYAQAYAFFLLPGRFWEFGVGGMLAVLPSFRLQLSDLQARILGWLGLAAVLFSATYYTGATRFPGYAVLLPVFGSLLLLLAGASQASWGVGRLLSLAPFQYFGRLSYSIYLWHWPILVLFEMRTPSWQRIVACVVATVLLAELTHRLIENPIRFNGYLKSHASASILSMAALSMIALVVTVSWWQIESRRASHDKFVFASRDNIKLSHPSCLVLQTSLQVDGCTLGDPAGSKTVVLFGDSHAWHWAPALDVLGQQRGWRVLVLAKASCSPEAIKDLWNDALGRPYTECIAWRQRAIERIDQLQPAAVVMSGDSDYRTGPRLDETLTYEQWRFAYDTTLLHFQTRQIRVFLIADVPKFPESVPECLARQAKFNTPCPPLQPSLVFNRVKERAELDATEGRHGTSLLNLVSALCRNGLCQETQDGTILYTDQDHLTATYARSLVPLLESRLNL